MNRIRARTKHVIQYMKPVSNEGMLVSSFDISDRTGLLSYKWSCGSVTEDRKLNADIEETEIRTVLHALHATKNGSMSWKTMDQTGIRDTSRYVPVRDLADKTSWARSSSSLACCAYFDGMWLHWQVLHKTCCPESQPGEVYYCNSGPWMTLTDKLSRQKTTWCRFSRSHKHADHLTSLDVICTTMWSIHV